MRRPIGSGEAGAAAAPLLGATLLLFLLVGALGLAEGARAVAMRTLGVRALAAAVDSATRAGLSDHGAAERAFQQVLKANLGPRPYTATLRISGRTVTGRLELQYRLEYLAAFPREVNLVVVQSAAAPERKAKP